MQAFCLSLLNLADDEGYFYANPAFVRSAVRPFDEASTTTRRRIARAVEIGWIEVRTHPTHGDIGRLPTFGEHQRIDRPKDSKLAEYWAVASTAVIDDESTTNRRRVDDASLLEQGTGNREGNREGNMEQGAGYASVELVDSVDLLREAWNAETKKPLPRWTETPKHRRKAALAALARRPLLEWRAVFAAVQASAFCRGESGTWRADVDWAIRAEGTKPEPALRLLEGGFAGAPPRPKSLAPARAEDYRAVFDALALLSPEERDAEALRGLECDGYRDTFPVVERLSPEERDAEALRGLE